MTDYQFDRRLRVQYPGALYHLTSRGVGRNEVFLSDDDRSRFFERAAATVARYGWRVYAVSLMPNHFHLHFRTPEPNLSAGAQYLLAHYARQFNRRHQRSGHLFEGRFRCRVIEDEGYSWTVSRYVHRNPVPALVAHPQDWLWSSYPGYCRQSLRLSWVCYDELLSAWQGDGGGDAESYRRFVEQDLSEPLKSPFEEAVDGWILGGQAFVQQIRGLISPQSEEPTAKRARRPMIPLEVILSAVCSELNVSADVLRRKGSRHPGRAIFAQLGRCESAATLQEIAEHLGLARRDCVPRLAEKTMLNNAPSDLTRQLQAVQRRLGIA